MIILPLDNCIILANYLSGAYDTYTSVEEAKKSRDRAYFLKLDNQNLDELPSGIESLYKLSNLSAKNNQIRDLPSSLCQIYDSLQWLYLDNNSFEKVPTLPPPCWDQKNDRTRYRTHEVLGLLSLSYNNITRLDNNFYNAYSSTLNLSNNLIEEISNDIKFPEHMSKLNLSHNKIATLPENFKRNALYWLNLSHNQLTTLPDRFGIDEEIKDESGQVVRWRYRNYKRLLDVSYNKIKKIPDAFLKNNKKIKKLILTGNPLSEAEVEKVRRALPDTEVVF